MFGLGVGEIVVVLVIALIFIGPKKLPGLAKGLGKGMREFQNAVGGITDQIKNPQQSVQETQKIVENDSEAIEQNDISKLEDQKKS